MLESAFETFVAAAARYDQCITLALHDGNSIHNENLANIRILSLVLLQQANDSL